MTLKESRITQFLQSTRGEGIDFKVFEFTFSSHTLEHTAYGDMLVHRTLLGKPSNIFSCFLSFV